MQMSYYLLYLQDLQKMVRTYALELLLYAICTYWAKVP